MSQTSPSPREAALRHAREAAGQRRSLHIPEWDVTVHARGFVSAAENHRFHRLASTSSGDGSEVHVNLAEVMARTIIGKLEDEAGRPVFSEDDLDLLLTQVPADLINRLYVFVRGEEELSPKKFRVTAG